MDITVIYIHIYTDLFIFCLTPPVHFAVNQLQVMLTRVIHSNMCEPFKFLREILMTGNTHPDFYTMIDMLESKDSMVIFHSPVQRANQEPLVQLQLEPLEEVFGEDLWLARAHP